MKSSCSLRVGAFQVLVFTEWADGSWEEEECRRKEERREGSQLYGVSKASADSSLVGKKR